VKIKKRKYEIVGNKQAIKYDKVVYNTTIKADKVKSRISNKNYSYIKLKLLHLKISRENIQIYSAYISCDVKSCQKNYNYNYNRTIPKSNILLIIFKTVPDHDHLIKIVRIFYI